MTNKERNIHVYIKYDEERERENKKNLYIYIYCIFHLRMIETVLWWIVSVAGDSSIFASRGLWVSALCHIAQRLNS